MNTTNVRYSLRSLTGLVRIANYMETEYNCAGLCQPLGNYVFSNRLSESFLAPYKNKSLP